MTKKERIINEIEKAGFGFAICQHRCQVEDALTVSAEDWDDDKGLAADYYGEFRGGFPWIHPELEAIAEKHGLYWEWENPGAIQLYV